MSDPLGLKFEAATRAIWPLVAAERSRGNGGGRAGGDIHDGRSIFQLRHPIDTDALLIEFKFAPGVNVNPVPPGSVSFSGADGSSLYGIAGRLPTSWFSRRMRARWWRRWNAAPRARVPFANPFSDLKG